MKALADIAPWRLAVVLEVERPGGAHRLAARTRAERRGLEGAADRHRAARRREMGKARDRQRPLQGAARRSGNVLAPGDVVYVEPLVGKDAGKFRLRQVPGDVRRDGGDGPVDRPRARAGRRLLVRPEPVQSRHAGAAPARLVVQAVRLRGRARQRLHALDRGDGRADRDRSGPRCRRLEAGELSKASSTARRRCASASSIRATS